MTVEDYFSTGPPHERPVFDAVLGFLETLGPIHVEPVSVGIFLKKEGSFMELRPKTKWVSVGFGLDRQVRHPLIRRKPIAYGRRFHHVANVASPDDLDEALLDLFAEAYLSTP
jgi:hypothetical protein